MPVAGDRPARLGAFPSLAAAAHALNLLASAGIDAELRNAHLNGALGEIPLIETWPEVWLRRGADLERAKDTLRAASRPAREPAWSCAACDEWLEGQFTACWRCGAPRA